MAQQVAIMNGAAGPNGVDADMYKTWLLRWGKESELLREDIVLWTQELSNGSPPYSMYRALNAARM